MARGKHHLRLGRIAAAGLCAALALVGCGVDSADEPTVTPTASATADATATATQAADQGGLVSEVSFEMGPEDSVFLELLARVPDTAETRHFVQMADAKKMNSLIGLELPDPASGQDGLETYIGELIERAREEGFEGMGSFIAPWPHDMGSYLSEWDPYPSVAISTFMAERSIAAGRAPHLHEVALGERFNPDVTAAALQECDCEQPDLREHAGVNYYSWGEDGKANLRRRFEPPMYDHLGRGPRLLVGDGYAYYSVSDKLMEELIDVTLDTVPSLADRENYADAARWLDGMGTIGHVQMLDTGFHIDEVAAGVNRGSISTSGRGVLTEYTADSVTQALTKVPLLLPFSMAASGVGYDGDNVFTGVVFAHDDETSAAKNFDRLVTRIRDGATDGRLANGEYTETLWADLLSRAEVHREGRYVMTRLYPVNANHNGTLIQGVLIRAPQHSLLVHE